MAQPVSEVMDDIGTALATVDGLRAFNGPPKSAQPPFAFPDFPELINFDCTFRRGCDRAEFTVVVGIADVVDRSVWEQILAYVDTIKGALDDCAGQTCRVTKAQIRPVLLAGTSYMGAIFTLDIVY